MITCRAYTEADYDLAVQWWKDWNFPVIPPEGLPKNGAVSLVDGVPAFICFLYSTDSILCWFELFISNKEIRHENRTIAMEVGLDFLKARAKELGFRFAFASVRNRLLGSRMINIGFRRTDENVDNYVLEV